MAPPGWPAAVFASLMLMACGGDKHRLIVLEHGGSAAGDDAGPGADDGGAGPSTRADAAAADGSAPRDDAAGRGDAALPDASPVEPPDAGAPDDAATIHDAGVCAERAATGSPLPEHLPAVGCATASQPTFNLALGGVATSNAPPFADGSVGALFDDNSGTDWAAAVEDEPWAAVDLGVGHDVTIYRVTSSGRVDRTGDPASWVLQGSNDARCTEASSWVTVDTRSGEVFGGPYDVRTFTLAAPATFRQYRLVVSESSGAPAVHVAELELFGVGTPVLSVDDAHRTAGPNTFAFSAAWNGQTFDPHSARYAGSTSWTSHVGAELTVSFVGSQIFLYGVKDPAHGILQVWLDDAVAGEADLYGPATAYNQLVYTSPTVCPGDHVLRVRVTGKKNPASRDAYGSLDRVVIVP